MCRAFRSLGLRRQSCSHRLFIVARSHWRNRPTDMNSGAPVKKSAAYARCSEESGVLLPDSRLPVSREEGKNSLPTRAILPCVLQTAAILRLRHGILPDTFSSTNSTRPRSSLLARMRISARFLSRSWVSLETRRYPTVLDGFSGTICQAERGNGFRHLPAPELIFPAAQPLHRDEGLRPDPQIAVHPALHRPGRTAAGNRETTQQGRAGEQLHPGRRGRKSTRSRTCREKRTGDRRKLQPPHQELHHLLELSSACPKTDKSYTDQ